MTTIARINNLHIAHMEIDTCPNRFNAFYSDCMLCMHWTMKTILGTVDQPDYVACNWCTLHQMYHCDADGACPID